MKGTETFVSANFFEAADDLQVAQLVEEAKALAKLDHPCVVKFTRYILPREAAVPLTLLSQLHQ